MQVLKAAGHYVVPEGEPNLYREHMRAPDLSVGTYCIPVGGKDGQQPHTEDEIYVVVRGHATLATDDEEVPVGPGSVVYLAAHVEHWFVDVTEDLTVVVVFAPAERSRS